MAEVLQECLVVRVGYQAFGVNVQKQEDIAEGECYAQVFQHCWADINKTNEVCFQLRVAQQNGDNIIITDWTSLKKLLFFGLGYEYSPIFAKYVLEHFLRTCKSLIMADAVWQKLW